MYEIDVRQTRSVFRERDDVETSDLVALCQEDLARGQNLLAELQLEAGRLEVPRGCVELSRMAARSVTTTLREDCALEARKRELRQLDCRELLSP